MRYEEQIMSKNKYPSIFSPQTEAILFIILQISFATNVVLKTGEYSRIFPSFSWEIFWSRDLFRPIARERKHLMNYKHEYFTQHNAQNCFFRNLTPLFKEGLSEVGCRNLGYERLAANYMHNAI